MAYGRRDAIECWARDEAEAASIRAQARLYKQLDHLRLGRREVRLGLAGLRLEDVDARRLGAAVVHRDQHQALVGDDVLAGQQREREGARGVLLVHQPVGDERFLEAARRGGDLARLTFTTQFAEELAKAVQAVRAQAVEEIRETLIRALRG